MEPEGNFQGSTIQCDLCLNEFSYNLNGESPKEAGFVVCTRCEYHQPLTKGPRWRDMAVFATVVGSLYMITIAALILLK